MISINNCCDTKPIIRKCDCGCDVETIECPKCGRIVYGCDNENIERWNKGDNDED